MLLDLPEALQCQIIANLHGDDRLRLFQVCQTFRDLVLQQANDHSAKLCISLDATPLHASARTALIRASDGPGVRLILKSSEGSSRVEATQAAALLFDSVARTHPGLLAGVTQVTMQGMQLDALIPSFIAAHCPVIQSLTLDQCKPSHSWAEGTAWLPTLPSLTHLHLSGVPVPQAIRQQLHKLPNLTSLTSDHPDGMLIAAHLGTQLTSLTCQRLPDPRVLCHSLSCCPRITTLHLPELLVTDDHCDMLLRMPALKDLTVSGFKVFGNYSQQQCTWQRLTMQTLDVSSMGLLPLNSVHHVTITDTGLPGTDCRLELGTWPQHFIMLEQGTWLQRIRRGVSNIAKCGGLRCASAQRLALCIKGGAGHSQATDAQVPGESVEQREVDAALSDVLSVISTWPGTLDIRGVAVTATVLQAISTRLRQPQELVELKFTNCTWGTDTLHLTLPALPPVPLVTLDTCSVIIKNGCTNQLNQQDSYNDLGGAEKHLMQLCAHAARPVHVRVVRGGSGEGALNSEEEHTSAVTSVNRKLRAAGHLYAMVSVC